MLIKHSSESQDDHQFPEVSKYCLCISHQTGVKWDHPLRRTQTELTAFTTICSVFAACLNIDTSFWIMCLKWNEIGKRNEIKHIWQESALLWLQTLKNNYTRASLLCFLHLYLSWETNAHICFLGPRTTKLTKLNLWQSHLVSDGSDTPDGQEQSEEQSATLQRFANELLIGTRCERVGEDRSTCRTALTMVTMWCDDDDVMG